jgi:hypothetical protein
MGFQTPGHAQEKRRERGRRGGSVPLGFAKREEKEGYKLEGSCGHGHMRENKGAKKREGEVFPLPRVFSKREKERVTW